MNIKKTIFENKIILKIRDLLTHLFAGVWGFLKGHIFVGAFAAILLGSLMVYAIHDGADAIYWQLWGKNNNEEKLIYQLDSIRSSANRNNFDKSLSDYENIRNQVTPYEYPGVIAKLEAYEAELYLHDSSQNRASFENAINHANHALNYHSKENDPNEYGYDKMILGEAYFCLGNIVDTPNNIKFSIDSLQEARESIDRTVFPNYYRETMIDLAFSYELLSTISSAEQNLLQAEDFLMDFDIVVKLTRENDPKNFAALHWIKGKIYNEQAWTIRSTDFYKKSLEEFNLVGDLFSLEYDPGSYVSLQKDMGLAKYRLSINSKNNEADRKNFVKESVQTYENAMVFAQGNNEANVLRTAKRDCALAYVWLFWSTTDDAEKKDDINKAQSLIAAVMSETSIDEKPLERARLLQTQGDILVCLSTIEDPAKHLNEALENYKFASKIINERYGYQYGQILASMGDAYLRLANYQKEQADTCAANKNIEKANDAYMAAWPIVTGSYTLDDSVTSGITNLIEVLPCHQCELQNNGHNP